MDVDPRPLALVAGAADEIGRELALQCARHGLDLLLVDAAPLAEFAAQLRTWSERVDYVETRLDLRESIYAIAAAIEGRSIDALCANVQRRRMQGDVLFELINLIAHDMSAAGSGRILIVSPGPGTLLDDYCCALRAELESSGVTVTCMHAQGDAEKAPLAELAFEAMLEGQTQVQATAAHSPRHSGANFRLR